MKLFATAVACAVLVAGAASAQDVRIQTRDLDLSQPGDVAILDARIETSARRLCVSQRSTGSNIRATAECREAVRQEVVRQLPPVARDDYTRVRSSRIAL